MNTDRTTIWIQSFTGIAVIVGLGLVVWELQQVRTLTRAQLTSDYFSVTTSVYLTIAGENPSSAMAKACSDPEKLSMGEILVLNRYFASHMSILSRMQLLTDRDELYEKGYWQELAPVHFAPILRTAYGRVWFMEQLSGRGWSQELLQTGQHVMDQLGSVSCKSRYVERIRALELFLEDFADAT